MEIKLTIFVKKGVQNFIQVNFKSNFSLKFNIFVLYFCSLYLFLVLEVSL